MAFDLPALLEARSAELTAYIAATRSVLWHPGQKGGAVEYKVREFIRSILPESLGVTEGVIYDSTGATSPQCDIIIYDRASAPIIFAENGTRAVPVECAYGVIEVKTRLDSSALSDAMDAMRRLKRLPKVAYRRAGAAIHKTFLLFGPPLDHYPLFYYVFAFEGIALESIAAQLQTILEQTPDAHEVINAITVLGLGTVAYANPGWISVPKRPCRVARYTGRHSLLLWLGLVLDMMLAAEMYYPLDFIRYINAADFNGVMS